MYSYRALYTTSFTSTCLEGSIDGKNDIVSFPLALTSARVHECNRCFPSVSRYVVCVGNAKSSISEEKKKIKDASAQNSVLKIISDDNQNGKKIRFFKKHAFFNNIANIIREQSLYPVLKRYNIIISNII